MSEQPDKRQGDGALVVLKVVGGIIAFFALLFIGFVFFIAVVCGVH